MKILIWLLAVASLVGCGDHKTSDQPPCDGWMLTSWAGSEALAGTIFMQLDPAGSFVLYQRVASPEEVVAGFVSYRGVYAVVPGGQMTPPQSLDVLTGSYDDATPWAASYLIVARDDQTMILRTLDKDVESIYKRVVIPHYVWLTTRGFGCAEAVRFL